MAINPKLGMSGVFKGESREEWRMFEVGIIFAVRFERRMMLTIDEELETIAIGEDGGIRTGTGGRLRAEIPIEVGFNDGALFRIGLSEIKSSAEFWDAEYVGNAGAFDALIGIDGTAVIKGAPGDNAADTLLSGGAAMNLGVRDGLGLLRGQIGGAAVLAAKAALGSSIGELSDAFSEEVGDVGQGITHADAAVGRGVVIVVGINVLNPIFGRIAIHRA